MREQENPVLGPLLQYMDRTWMRHPTRTIVRINNDVEEWHRRLMQKAQHPNIEFYRCFDVIKKGDNFVTTQSRNQDCACGVKLCQPDVSDEYDSPQPAERRQILALKVNFTSVWRRWLNVEPRLAMVSCNDSRALVGTTARQRYLHCLTCDYGTWNCSHPLRTNKHLDFIDRQVKENDEMTVRDLQQIQIDRFGLSVFMTMIKRHRYQIGWVKSGPR
ncbi:hypothetical protein Bbelb_256100 [Branchiostoma belcheri]|nr:hypothetical protein Bbelb_256100 [Branchiostoma belcheri]